MSPRGAQTATVLLIEPDEYRLRRYVREIVHDSSFHLLDAVTSKRAAWPTLHRARPDLVVVNALLPDGNGAEVARELLRHHPEGHTLICAATADEKIVVRCVEAGADGYIVCGDEAPELLPSLRILLSGGSPVSPQVARCLMRGLRLSGRSAASAGPGPLSQRELTVLGLMAKGIRLAEVADILSISPHTVCAHTKKIYRKLKVHSRGEAVYEARQMKLIED